tara:strand:+ start:326 stop:544 length:219 start_codon:yes stop_codon:yes gene_type:complete
MISPKINLDKDFFYYDENGKKILLNPEEIIFDDQSENDEDYNDENEINEDFDDENFLQKLWNAIYEFFELLQ